MFKFKDKKDFRVLIEKEAKKHNYAGPVPDWVVEFMEKAYTQGLEDSKMLNTRCCEGGTQWGHSWDCYKTQG